MLIDIPWNKIDEFIEVLKKDKSQSLFVVNWIENFRKRKEKDEQLKLSLSYTAESWDTGVFVGTLKSESHKVISAFALEEKDEYLEKTLTQFFAELKGKFYLEGIAEKHVELVNKLVDKVSTKKKHFDLTVASTSLGEAFASSTNKTPEDVISDQLPLLAQPQTPEQAENEDCEEKLLEYAKDMVQNHHKLCVYDGNSGGYEEMCKIRYYSVVRDKFD